MILVTAITYVERYGQWISTWNYNKSPREIKSRRRFSYDWSDWLQHMQACTCACTQSAGGGWPYSGSALFSLGENLSPLLRKCIMGNGGVICLLILAKSLSIVLLISHRGTTSWGFIHKSNTIHSDACSSWCTEAPVEVFEDMFFLPV